MSNNGFLKSGLNMGITVFLALMIAEFTPIDNLALLWRILLTMLITAVIYLLINTLNPVKHKNEQG
ncbi:hypothetical protein [Alkalibacterium kapii]|uniref:Uncharacterized protein n=1 Tax=Alkalibacterium kapii TaxID=426704 RepID=A0A511AVQ1_9LACT|nr:hypothetical protein [Alkalibacterium kapii]GEK91201.1 hypothetical protein AKA01nite_08230 [Alkalibacterium kapii]